MTKGECACVLAGTCMRACVRVFFVACVLRWCVRGSAWVVRGCCVGVAREICVSGELCGPYRFIMIF
jgi:hypothetical protein